MAQFTGRPFRVDGTPIPTPDIYKFGAEDLSTKKSGRTLDGVMHKDVVDTKDYYECTWKVLSWEDAAVLLNAVDGKKKVRFTYADPRRPNRFVTNDFYIGKRAAGALNLNDPEFTWTDITMQFTRI